MPKTPTFSAQVNIRLPLDLAEKLWSESGQRKWTPSAYVRIAIEEKLARDAKKGGK